MIDDGGGGDKIACWFQGGQNASTAAGGYTGWLGAPALKKAGVMRRDSRNVVTGYSLDWGQARADAAHNTALAIEARIVLCGQREESRKRLSCQEGQGGGVSLCVCLGGDGGQRGLRKL